MTSEFLRPGGEPGVREPKPVQEERHPQPGARATQLRRLGNLVHTGERSEAENITRYRTPGGI